MKSPLLKISIIILLSIFCSKAYSQTEADSSKQISKVIVKMANGQEYRGQVLKKDDDKVVLKTVNGEVSLIAANIKSIENDNYEGKFEFANPHDTRYFFTPSAIPLKKGKGYYQNVLVSANFINIGVSDNISLGGGFEFISTVLGSPTLLFTPKVGFHVAEKLHVGGGIMLGTMLTEDIDGGLVYGVMTTGTSETNISFGGGLTRLDGESYGAFMLSGTHRVSKNIALLSENYLFTDKYSDGFYFGIHGLRILSKNNAFDVGIIFVPVIARYVPALPYVGYARTFESKKSSKR